MVSLLDKFSDVDSLFLENLQKSTKDKYHDVIVDVFKEFSSSYPELVSFVRDKDTEGCHRIIFRFAIPPEQRIHTFSHLFPNIQQISLPKPWTYLDIGFTFLNYRYPDRDCHYTASILKAFYSHKKLHNTKRYVPVAQLMNLGPFLPNHYKTISCNYCGNYYVNSYVQKTSFVDAIYLIFQSYFSSKYNTDLMDTFFRTPSFFYMLKDLRLPKKFASTGYIDNLHKAAMANDIDKWNTLSAAYLSYSSYMALIPDYEIVIQALSKRPTFWTNLSRRHSDLYLHKLPKDIVRGHKFYSTPDAKKTLLALKQ